MCTPAVRGSLLHTRGEVGDVAEDVVLHARLADDAGEDVAAPRGRDARLTVDQRSFSPTPLSSSRTPNPNVSADLEDALVRILRDAHLRHQTRHREVPVPHGLNFRHAAFSAILSTSSK